MRKQKINVIDLDNTLVKYDTFRELVLREIRRGNWTIMVSAILRFARIITADNIKARIQRYLVNNYPKNFFIDYANDIYQRIDSEVMEIVSRNTDKDTIIVLISASPNEYIQPLCDLLSWKGSGSYFDEKNDFHHLYGIEKISWLKKFYPETEFQYNFAISDSKTDMPLLELFEQKLIIKNN